MENTRVFYIQPRTPPLLELAAERAEWGGALHGAKFEQRVGILTATDANGR
jgi:hypothetical protein